MSGATTSATDVAPTRSAVGSLVAAARYAPSLRRGLGVTMVLALLGTGGQVVVPISVQLLLDRVLVGPGPAETSRILLGGTVAVGGLVVALVANRIALFRLIRAASEGLAELRVAAFDRLHRRSVLHVEAERRGSLVARVTSDIEAIIQFLEWGGIGMVVGSAQIALVLVVMAVYDVVLAGSVLVAAVVYGGLLVLFQRVLRRAYDRVRARVARSLAAMGEAISGLPTIRAYGAEARTLRRVDAALEDQYRAEVRTALLGATMFSTAELFAAALTAGVVALGILAVPGLTAGQLVAFLFLVALITDPVQLLVEVLNEAQTAASGVRRVLEVVEAPAELEDPGREGQVLPGGPLGVSLQGVRFRYPTGADVLAELDVELRAGLRYAVVGETGSGKSTFVKLVTRLLDPAEGQILLGGVPLRDVAFDELRRRVAFVPQDGFLWDTTVRENLRLGRPEATDEEVAAAVADLGLDGWVAGLLAGLDTSVGERGSRLSAGERQLVALARAWLRRPDLLVLDEATSAVDPALEVALRRAIERLTAGRTSLTVAHRLATAEAADEVLAFAAGRLVQRGPHHLLVAAEGPYARLHAEWVANTAR